WRRRAPSWGRDVYGPSSSHWDVCVAHAAWHADSCVPGTMMRFRCTVRGKHLDLWRSVHPRSVPQPAPRCGQVSEGVVSSLTEYGRDQLLTFRWASALAASETLS